MTPIRLFKGIICSVAAMAALFYFFLFWNPMRIHDVNLLKWVPILICFVALYISGRINNDTSKKLLPLLFIPFVIFDLFNFFYLPFILILFTVGTLTILLTRDDFQPYYKAGFAITIVGIFVYFLFSQPLILENNNFGYDKDGEMVNATVLWDFSDDHPNQLPSHPLVDRNSNNYNLQDFKGKTYFISFWATWCGPCIEKKPELDRLKATYQNNPNVEFIDISIDEDRNRWRTFLEKEKPAGLQLVTPHVNRTRRTLGISAIPLYYTVNAEGFYKEFPTFEQASVALKNNEIQ